MSATTDVAGAAPDHIECVLPHCAVSLSFLKLSRRDKLKAIDLGMKFLAMGDSQLQYWNNEQWEGKMASMRERHGEALGALRSELRVAKERQLKVVADHKAAVQLLVSQVEARTTARYEGEVSDLRRRLTEAEGALASNLHKSAETYRETFDEFQSKLDSKEKHWEERSDKLRAEYEQRLQAAKAQAGDLLVHQQNSTIKGQDGENFTIHELNRRFPCGEVEDTHKKKGRGDFILKDAGLCVLIETKNYKNNVTKPEIDKFYRDIEANQDIQCGLFLSLKSGVCAKGDFHLEVRDGKPVIFLHNVSDNMRNVELAVQMLRLVLGTDCIDLCSEEVLGKLRNCIPMIKRNWKKMRQKIAKFEQDMLGCILSQETLTRSLFDTIDLKY